MILLFIILEVLCHFIVHYQIQIGSQVAFVVGIIGIKSNGLLVLVPHLSNVQVI